MIINDLNQLEATIDAIAAKESNITVSFLRGRKFAVSENASFSLSQLVHKASTLYQQQQKQESAGHFQVYRILDKISDLHIRAEIKLLKTNCAIRIFTYIKRLFSHLIFHRTNIAKSLKEHSIKQALTNEHSIRQIATTSKFHGTAFSTLFTMSKVPGKEKNALLPFGKLVELEIPCFAGELKKGIYENGVNKKNTSWTDDIGTAVHYASGEVVRKMEVSYRKLDNCKEEYEIVFIQKASNYFSYSLDFSEWQYLFLDLRRLRAVDEERFQRDYKAQLLLWANAVIKDLERKKKEDAERGETFNHPMYDATIGYAKKFIEILNNPIPIKLAENEEERKQLQDMSPIVFTAFELKYEKKVQAYFSEYDVSQPVKLGEDIQIIFTENNSIEKVRQHLAAQQLSQKVHVLSLDILKKIANDLQQERKERILAGAKNSNAKSN